MRLLLTSTMMVGIALPVLSGGSPVHAQSAAAPVDDTTGTAPVDPSLFSASILPVLRGSSDIVPPVASASANPRYRSATTDYPVVPTLPAERAMAEQQTSGQTSDLGDYDPEGIRAGSFVLYPSLSILGTVTDNVDNDSRSDMGHLGKLETSVKVESDWDRHSLELNGSLGFTGYQQPDRKPENEQHGDGELILELSDETDVSLTGSVDRTMEEPSSIELITSGGQAAIETTLNGGVQIDHDAGLIQLQLRGSVESANYEEDPARDYKTYTLGGRVGFEATDQVMPFADVEVSRKIFDKGPNSEDGDSLRGAFGIAITEREKLSGEFSVGAMSWQPKQKSSKEDTILFADASLTWSPNSLWSLTGGIETSLTSTATSANSVSTHTVSLGADYALRRNVTIGFDSSLARNIYRGSSMKDWEYDATLRAEYSLSRYTKLVASATHEGRSGNVPDSDYHANSVQLGVTFQR
ncbi:outer membrane beta-barrel protein [uncultured Cohaesibacter sp.]|uniref:outer membrane beta-barrel protein n=1 Tax=uncultured Cohaesibacter sp. TaxID=1002546 RepID=UPI0029C8749D|nr:outer membrane beta-barrel protein [uncultured Cohaesibacter sp.]